MLFTSLSFLLFLVLLFAVYYIVPYRFRWVLLLVFSAVFYAFAGLSGFIFIGITIISTYTATRLIGSVYEKQTDYLKNTEGLSRQEKKEYKEKSKRKMRLFLVPCLIINFGILALLKYILVGKGFLGIGLILPMGISFYTFQTMGYLIDVYRGKVSAEKNIFKMALFTSYFPLLVQGPISDYKKLTETLYTPAPFSAKNFLFGFERVLWGYFKKLVIADRLIAAVTTITGDSSEYYGAYAFLGMILYAIQLYADFTGGIDITIGISQMLGIRLQENFDRPYFSKNISEYWRRWHITLGEWFKEYLFYPISVAKPMLKLSKFSREHFGDAIGKRLPVYISTIVVWFTTGVWHGRGLRFMVWGLLNCFIILVSQELSPLYKKFHGKFPTLKDTSSYKAFEITRTFLMMGCLKMFDCYADVTTTFRMFASFFTGGQYKELLTGGLFKVGISAADYIVVLVGVLIIFTVSMKQRKFAIREKLFTKPMVIQCIVIALLFVVIVVFGAYGVGYDSKQFIYNQF